jgi:hypothetical protein
MNFNKKALAALSIILLIACNKNVEQRFVPSFEPTSVEQNGGNWKPVLLANVSEPAITAPDAVNSTAYQNELLQIAQAQANLTATDRSAIEQWKGSGIIKWNEMARQLVAKYNLPPEANPDGTYPVPSAANPGAYPKFPFANPPYASRAYAHLSVALYDALVSCWKYKFQYSRMSPAANSNTIKTLEPVQSNLPAYPSEDAVIAQVSMRLLNVMFPLDSVEVKSMAATQKRAKLLSGVASASDIAAGEAIANYVVEKTLARYRTDGMGNAAGNPALWAQLETAATANGATVLWKSLETPARPTMLPFFGNVRLWNFSSAQRDSMRPAAPPPVGSPEFATALAEVKNYARTPTSETWRIAMYWADGAGTYTPPGHWNEIACNLIAQSSMSELRAARTLCLMNTAMQDAGICCWDTKSYYYYPRPSQFDGSIKTIGLPNFPSYTSGHSTFSGAAATVLGYVFPGEKGRMDAMAKEASESRIYGGIHFRFDCEVGLRCGKAIGGFAVERGRADGAG